MKPTILILVLLLSLSCKKERAAVQLNAPKSAAYTKDTLTLTKAHYHDKVLGALVGSAIGDAMGASTEMWHRKDIQLKYGYITGLTPAERVQSPEGTWENNLLAGATTDDTRWKYLMVDYLKKVQGAPNAAAFSNYITEYYQFLAHDLQDPDIATNTDLLDEKMEKLDWIKEWARVSMAYDQDPNQYLAALNRFYGGEMSCAGQLYTPMFGLIAKNTEEAYALGYEHALFDIGYAKDISALVAAMVQMALRTQDMHAILNVVPFTDTEGYQDSRLVGRIPYAIWTTALQQVRLAEEGHLQGTLALDPPHPPKAPKHYPGTTMDWAQQEQLYRFLENEKRAIPFHSAEIWQIMVTGMAHGKGDFLKTLQFIVNYGRDNDTVAAVAGMILGAQAGYAQLPKELREDVVRVNKENLGIDLEAMAGQMTALAYP